MARREPHSPIQTIAFTVLASLYLACSSGPDAEPGAHEPTATPPVQPMTSPAAEPSAMPTEPEAQAATDTTTQPTSPAEEATRPAATEPDDSFAAPDAAAPDVQSACYAAAKDDACETCVCTQCVEPLEDCAATPGCPEILACVLESGCTGLDCFCGSEPLPTCVGAQGAGSGPCREVVLSAPGGRQPDLVNLSAGPASDSAIAVSTCATADTTCGSVCSADAL